MIKRLVVALIIGIFLLNFAAARIDISGTEKIYNYGDKLQFTVTTFPTSVYGFFEITLSCNNESISIYKIPANEDGFPIGNENKYSNYLFVDKSVLGTLEGICFLQAKLGDEIAKSENFEITHRILVETTLDKEKYDPGNEISLSIKATKANGQPLEGFLEISGDAVSSKAVENGAASISFSVPGNMRAGNHFLILQVYDRGKNNAILNFENITKKFIVNQIPSRIEISLNTVDIIPGNTSLEIVPQIFDQSGEEMDTTLLIKIMDPKSEETEYSVVSKEKKEIKFEANQMAGEYKIIASLGGIVKEKIFRILELQKISLEIIEGDNILLVKNIGNVKYNKSIEVFIGNSRQVIENVKLDVGEEKKYRINAPDGEYEISISDGESQTKKRMFLTGDAISIQGESIDFSKYRIVLYFIIVIILALILILLAKNKERIIPNGWKTRKPLKTFKTPLIEYETKAEKKVKEEKRKEMEQYVKVQGNSGGIAESSGILEGKKYISPVISIKVHNMRDLKRGGMEEINRIVERLKEQKAMVEFRDTYIVAIISPLITRKFENEATAVKLAFDLKQELEAYNRRAAEKVDFNIGVNSGEILSSLNKGKLRYTSLGNTTLLAKKISDSDTGKLIISEGVRSKMMRNVKIGEIKQVGSSRAYSVNSVADINANQEKLKDLMKRMNH